jgi:hypothetical protein
MSSFLSILILYGRVAYQSTDYEYHIFVNISSRLILENATLSWNPSRATTTLVIDTHDLQKAAVLLAELSP